MNVAYWIAISVLAALCVGTAIYFYVRLRHLFLSIAGVNVSILLTAISAKNATSLYDQIIGVTCLVAAAGFHIASLIEGGRDARPRKNQHH